MYNDQARRLGLVHWYLLRSVAEEEARRPNLSPEGTVHIGDLFARVVASKYQPPDINWWVHTQEKDPPELLRRVTNVLSPAKRIEKAAEDQMDEAAKPPLDLHEFANAFSEVHRDDIEQIAEFVAWLASRDVLAPGILFRGAVWTDSRRAERIVEIPQSLTDQAVERCADIVFGLFINGDDTEVHVRGELQADIYESGWEHDEEPEVDEAEVSRRTRAQALREFSHYCFALRRSLLQLQNEILRIVPPTELLHNQHFWRTFIQAARKSVEKQTWDFKQSLDFWHAPSEKRDAAQFKFVNQAAAFANADGGVFIVGFRDDDRALVGVDELEDRMKATADVVQRLAPGLGGRIVMEPITFPPAAQLPPALVIVIPQTKDVIAVRDTSGRYSYPQRMQTGLVQQSPELLSAQKLPLTTDNFEFLSKLRLWGTTA